MRNARALLIHKSPVCGLRRQLVEKGIAGIAIPANGPDSVLTLVKAAEGSAGVDDQSDKGVKVALFRSLFRGCEDVYAIRKQVKNGEWGYVPHSIRIWKAVLSTDAALRKKVNRQTRKLLPLTDDVLRKHLEGKQTIGVYPLLLDETCWFLAVVILTAARPGGNCRSNGA